MDWLTEKPIAHRGLHTPETPENTLAAFEAAIEAGYPIECDVRVAGDGVPVVVHDQNLHRLTGRDVAISEIPSSEIAGFSVLETGEQIPLFATVLDAVDGAVPLLVELKGHGMPGRLEEAVTSHLESYEGEFAVQAFNPLSVAWFRRQRPEWSRGQLAGHLEGTDVGAVQRILLKRLLVTWLSRPDFVGYEHDKLPSSPVARRRERGLPVLAWTVRSDEELARVRDHADNVIFEGFQP